MTGRDPRASSGQDGRGPRGRRRVTVVTGTRAEYGLLKSTLHAITEHPALELQVVAAGMHLLRKFGHTLDDVMADGWPIAARIPMQTGSDAARDQAEGLARGVNGIARFLATSRTEIVLVLGDRVEALAGALAAVSTGRVLAHIHGGDVAQGDLDERFRHAITKLADIHLPATRDSARRIIRMGEPRERVFVVGAPGLDDLGELVREQGGITPLEQRPRSALVVQHPCGRAAAVERRLMAAILKAVTSAQLEARVIYPNSDRGHSGIIAAIESAKAGGRLPLRVERSLPRSAFLRELLQARLLIGNSSAGIIEAATAGTPVVNVGDRQAGRLRSGPSVIDCAESFADMCAALHRALAFRFPKTLRSAYGAGGAGRRIANIVATVAVGDRTRCKQITY